MKYRYYIGDPDIPWWVEELVKEKLIVEVRENAAVTFFLTYRQSKTDPKIYYLYEGDFIELNEETGSVTIGYEDWDTALKEHFKRSDWDTVVDSIKRSSQSRARKRANEAARYKNYWT